MNFAFRLDTYALLTLICILLGGSVIGGRCEAQTFESSQQVDTLTYNALVMGDYAQTAALGKQALQQGYDWYWLRYRMGRSYYELNRYYKAQPHLEKAVRLNQGDTLARLYLASAYAATGLEFEAEAVLAQLPKRLKKKRKLKSFQPITGAFGETGLRLSDQQDTISDAIYLQIGLQHQLHHRLQLNHSLTYATQEYFDGFYRYLDYHATALWYAGRKITLAGYTHLISNVGERNGAYSDAIADVDYDGQYKQTILQFGLGGIINWKRLSLVPSAAYTDMQISSETDYRVIYTYNDSLATVSFSAPTAATLYWAGLSTYYTLPILDDRITPGLTVSAAAENDEWQMQWAASLRVQANRKTAFTLSYSRPQSRLYSEKLGSNWIYSPDIIQHRYLLLLERQLNQRFVFYTGLLGEHRESSLFNYSLTTFFISLKLSL